MKLDSDGLRRDPQNVRRNNYANRHSGIWYYEEKNGLYVVVEYINSGRLENKTFIIPRSQILKYARVAKSL